MLGELYLLDKVRLLDKVHFPAEVHCQWCVLYDHLNGWCIVSLLCFLHLHSTLSLWVGKTCWENGPARRSVRRCGG